MKKKGFILAFLALWMAALLALGIYYVCFAPRDARFSESENRTLAAFPDLTADTLFSGRFGEDLESYLLDSFPGRSWVVSATSRIQSLLSFASHEEYLLIAEDVDDPLDEEMLSGDLDDLLEDLVPETTAPQVTEPAETVPATQPGEPAETLPAEDPPIEHKPKVMIDSIPQTLGMYMDVGYGETALRQYNRKNVLALTAVLNKFARLLPENGKLMFTMGPPSYLVNRFVNAETKIRFYNTWDEAINAMGADNVYAFDSCEILSKAIQQGEYVSFRTDNHWTPYGAYLVYSQMAARAGKEVCSYWEDFDISVETPFRGTYYRDNPTAYHSVQPDELALLMPKTAVEWRQVTGPDSYKVLNFLHMDAYSNDRYTVYLHGPGGPWRYAQCDNGETENCLVVTDSFGLTVIPFLTQNYNQVHYYDARYFDAAIAGGTVAELMEKYNIQDVYVIVADFHTFESSFLLSTAIEHLGA